MIELKEQKAIPVLCIRTHASVGMLPQVIGEGYAKIMAYMETLGQQPSDIPYVAYYTLDMQNLDISIGFPVAKALPATQGIESSEIAPGLFVETVYTGPYSQMEKTYNDIFAWMQENKLEQSGECYEYYYNSPEEVPESELKTRISIRVKRV